MIIGFTGLSDSGKTTICNLMMNKLKTKVLIKETKNRQVVNLIGFSDNTSYKEPVHHNDVIESNRYSQKIL